MQIMDFALQTNLYEATQFFDKTTASIYIRHNNAILPFKNYSYNPKGGNCYNLSCWALMGLHPDSQLVYGQIDLPGDQKWQCQPNYGHGWTIFTYNGKDYVYDSLKSHIWPRDYWEGTYHPHDVILQITQLDLLGSTLTADNAYQISDHLWQFKAIPQLALSCSPAADNLLKLAISESQVKYSYGQTSFFLAVSH